MIALVIDFPKLQISKAHGRRVLVLLFRLTAIIHLHLTVGLFIF